MGNLVAKALAGIGEHPSNAYLRRMIDNSNVELYDLATTMLKVEPGQRVLDVGFGGGKSLRMIIDEVGDEGKVFGVDPTKECVEDASTTYAEEIKKGQVSLHQGVVDELPYGDDSIDSALTLNCIYFWKDVNVGLQEFRRVLKNGGKLAVGLKTSVVTSFYAQRAMNNPLLADQVEAKLTENGFVNIEISSRAEPNGKGEFYCVMGTNRKDPETAKNA